MGRRHVEQVGVSLYQALQSSSINESRNAPIQISERGSSAMMVSNVLAVSFDGRNQYLISPLQWGKPNE